jgi:hypothetical protein
LPKKNFKIDNNIEKKENLDYFFHLSLESKIFLNRDKHKKTGFEILFYIYLYHNHLTKKFQKDYNNILKNKISNEEIPFDLCLISSEVIYDLSDIKKWIYSNK